MDDLTARSGYTGYSVIIDALRDSGVFVEARESTGENDVSWQNVLALIKAGRVPRVNITAEITQELAQKELVKNISATEFFDAVERVYGLLGLKPVRAETRHDYMFSRAKLRIDTRRESAQIVLLKDGNFVSIGTFF